MKKITYLFIVALTCLFTFSVEAQCDYTIELSDSFGDGWNGVSNMDVLVNGGVVLDDIAVPGGMGLASFTFTVDDTLPDDITTAFNPAAVVGGPDWAEECGFRILDALGVEVFTSNFGTAAGPPADVITTDIVEVCPACDIPVASYAVVSNCPVDSDFTIDVTITDIGAATSVTISDDQATTPVVVLAASVPTTINFGAYTNSTPVIITVTNDDDGTCTVSSTVLTFSNACPPANNDCTAATAVVCGGGPYVGDTTDATIDVVGDCGSVDNDAPNVFYTYTGPGSAENVTLTLCGSAYDTSIAVYSGACGALVCVANNDDFCAVQSEVTFLSDGVTTYTIMIEGWNITSIGAYTLDVTCVPAATPPANDTCASAESLTVGAAATPGDNTDATSNILNPSCDMFGVISDVWYSFVAPVSGVVDIITVLGTADQANIALYSDCTQGTELGCASGTGGETATVGGLTPAVVYYLQVWNDGAGPEAPPQRAQGTFTVQVTENTLSLGDLEINGFEYFPNPVNDNLTLRSLSNIQNVAVYNMLGQEVMKMNPNAVDAEVDMRNLSQGAYFVKVTINDVTDTIRIIKK